MAGRVEGKVAIVTGAARGIGRMCAELLAREGAHVVIGDIDDDLGGRAATEIRGAGGDALFQRTNVVQEEQCAALIEAALHAHDRLDVLVNNVGWFPRATLDETTTMSCPRPETSG